MLRNVFRLIVLAMVVPLAASAAPAPAVRPVDKLVIGVSPEMNVIQQRERYAPLRAYLAKKVGVPVQFAIEPKYGNLADAFQAEKLDGAFFGSFGAAQAIDRFGAVPVARPVGVNGVSTYKGRIFIRKDSGLRGWQDLKGKRAALVDRQTTAGYVWPLAWLRQNGVANPQAFFGVHDFAGSHDAAIYAVLEKKADVGAAKDTVYDKLKAQNPRIADELVVLGDSPAVPSNGLLVRADLPQELRAKLAAALLEANADPEGAAALYQLGAVKFVETKPADYKPVLDMAKAAGLDLTLASSK